MKTWEEKVFKLLSVLLFIAMALGFAELFAVALTTVN